MSFDVHVHTVFSFDAHATMEDYCAVAQARGIRTICFCEHLDVFDGQVEYFDADAYFATLARMQKRYGRELNLLAGLEFDSPHLHPKILRELNSLPFDMIMGSIHLLTDEDFQKAQHGARFSRERWRRYWRLCVEMVSAGDCAIDAVAHLSFPYRVYGSLVYEEPVLRDLFSAMVARDIVPEINISSLRRGRKLALPDAEILSLYAQCGGRRVTFGSDAHWTDHFGNPEELAYAASLMEAYALQPVYIQKRRKIAAPFPG